MFISNFLQIIFGETQLVAVNDNSATVRQVLNDCLTEISDCKTRANSNHFEIERLKSERDATFSLATAANTKAAMLETDVFTKFAAVLNAKKRKIAELLDGECGFYFTHFQTNDFTDSTQRSPPPILTRLSSEKAQIDDENGEDTDTERVIFMIYFLKNFKKFKLWN